MYIKDRLKQTIIDNLQKHMKRQGISGVELARQINVRQATISSILTGKSSPFIWTLAACANVLGVKLKDILEDDR